MVSLEVFVSSSRTQVNDDLAVLSVWFRHYGRVVFGLG